MQQKITKQGPLLDELGHVATPGYATSLMLDYERSAIKASRFRIKEWDYYIVMNDEYGVAFTIADNAYLGFISVTYFDFLKPSYHTISRMKWFPMGSFGMPNGSQKGDVSYEDKGMSLSYLHTNEGRKIICHINQFKNKEPFDCDILLAEEPKESMVIATPFKKNKKAFYYNQKINCMKASGTIQLGAKTVTLSDTTTGTLDWGRGVWTYDNTWYWGSVSGYIDGVPFGFNIGHGFGDTSHATENMLFYDGKAHKLEKVEIQIPTKNGIDDFMSPWKITSNDGRLECTFTPILDRADKINVMFLVSDQHQTFGHINGTVILDDGTVLEIKNLLGFAEKVRNKW